MTHVTNAGLVQHRRLVVGDPDRGEVGQERRICFIGNAQRLEVGLALPCQDSAGAQRSLRHGNLVQQNGIGARFQRGAVPQVNAGKWHAQIVVEGAADLEQFLVQVGCLQVRFQISRHVQQQRDRQHDLLLTVCR